MSDLISRQYLLDEYDRQHQGPPGGARKIIAEAPSIVPQRKPGHWIYGEHDVAMTDGYHCDQCGFFVPWDYQHKFIDFIKDYHYCPSCGNPMQITGKAVAKVKELSKKKHHDDAISQLTEWIELCISDEHVTEIQRSVLIAVKCKIEELLDGRNVD